jgi:hypothetical protein
LILISSAFLLFACVSPEAQVEYSKQFSQSSENNRAVQSTAEAMDTDDVLASLSQQLGAKDQYTEYDKQAVENMDTEDVLTGLTNSMGGNDQYEAVTISNVYFVRDLDELSDPAYGRYTLRIADDMPVRTNHKALQQNFRMKIEETLIEYPHSFIAVNKQDRIIAVAGDRLEAQALAQKEPRVFYVVKGETLKTAIKRWADQADWHAQWAVDKDYDIVAPATVFGQFSAQGGSLDQLLNTFRYLDSPMKAQFARNRVVVIRENNYSSDIMTVMP